MAGSKSEDQKSQGSRYRWSNIIKNPPPWKIELKNKGENICGVTDLNPGTLGVFFRDPDPGSV